MKFGTFVNCRMIDPRAGDPDDCIREMTRIREPRLFARHIMPYFRD